MRAHDQHPPQDTVATVRHTAEPQQATGPGLVPGVLDADAILHLQRTAGNASVAALLEAQAPEVAAPSPVLDVLSSGGGSPLDTDLRSAMEAGFGADFSGVRIHTDAAATESARSIGAQAYTVGRDIVVQSDQWAPDTTDGRHLLAHELTHVLQQETGPVEGIPTAEGLSVSDPGDRFEQEAERTAAAITSAPERDGAAP
jgi:hypothetical protein